MFMHASQFARGLFLLLHLNFNKERKVLVGKWENDSCSRVPVPLTVPLSGLSASSINCARLSSGASCSSQALAEPPQTVCEPFGSSSRRLQGDVTSFT